MRNRFSYSKLSLGKPVRVGAGELTPYSRATIVHLPGLLGGIVWSRPGGVLVKREDGSEIALPIPDATRRAQFAILGLGLLGGLVARLVLGQRR